MNLQENEYYQEELRNLQRKLLKLSRDKNFLLDRLTSYEDVGYAHNKYHSSLDSSDRLMIRNRTTQKLQQRRLRTDQQNLSG